MDTFTPALRWQPGGFLSLPLTVSCRREKDGDERERKFKQKSKQIMFEEHLKKDKVGEHLSKTEAKITSLHSLQHNISFLWGKKVSCGANKEPVQQKYLNFGLSLVTMATSSSVALKSIDRTEDRHEMANCKDRECGEFAAYDKTH